MNIFNNKRDSKNMAKGAAALLLVAGGIFCSAAQADDLSCKMRFSLKGWSAIYKTAKGHGTITCSDGSMMKVHLSTKGGGLTVGKTTIDDGKGDFTGVKNINDVLGDYVAAAAHGAVIKAGAATALTKGEVSLALSGTGRGWDVGVDLSGFSIHQIVPKPVVVVAPVVATPPQ